MTDRDTLIEFPCDFPIKVMGVRHDDLGQQLLAIVQAHNPGFDASTVEMRPSSQGNYIGYTFTIRATSQQQLDDLYRALGQHELVKLVL